MVFNARSDFNHFTIFRNSDYLLFSKYNHNKDELRRKPWKYSAVSKNVIFLAIAFLCSTSVAVTVPINVPALYTAGHNFTVLIFLLNALLKPKDFQ